MKIDLRIKRFNPEVDRKPHWETYTVEVDESDRVLDALHQVKWHTDGTLSFRRSCAHGVCGSDAMVINGQNRLACVLLVRDVGPEITVEPIRGLPVVKDLVVDMEPFFEGYRSVLPALITHDDPGPRERVQSPEQRARFDDTTKCILCAACTTSCPVFWAQSGGAAPRHPPEGKNRQSGGSAPRHPPEGTNSTYVGPAAIVNAHRFIFDSRDDGAAERLDILGQRTGVWGCRTAFNCTDACPRGIKVTQAIQEVKRAALGAGEPSGDHAEAG